MNQETQTNNEPQQTERADQYEVSIFTTELSTLKHFLEEITKASEKGDLDGFVELTASVSLMGDPQNENRFKALEEFIESQKHIGGLNITAKTISYVPFPQEPHTPICERVESLRL